MKSTDEATEIRVQVALGPRSYEVRVVSGLTAGFGAFVRITGDRQ